MKHSIFLSMFTYKSRLMGEGGFTLRVAYQLNLNLKLDFIALNDCLWVNWHNLGEKMFRTALFCENCFGTRNS